MGYFLFFTACMIIPAAVLAMPKWEDVFYSTGPYVGSSKISLSQMTAEQRAFYQEKCRDEINYCLANVGKSYKEVDAYKRCNDASHNLSFYAIALKYISEYGDPSKAFEYAYKYWETTPNGEVWESEAPMNGLDILNWGFEILERYSRYKEALIFYKKSYPGVMKQLSEASDTKILVNDFKAYQEKWPDQAERYDSFIRGWNKAKILVSTEEPKPLDAAVQNHEWFYSEKQGEVLKALTYYHKLKVKFMLEKALKHKDHVVATKANLYLEQIAPE